MENLTVLVYIGLCFGAALSHPHKAYHHEDEITKVTELREFPIQDKWMKNVNNLTPLKMMSLPGTHDSGARDAGLLGWIAQTQSLYLDQQLKIGIRAFDIRLMYKENPESLHVVHGSPPFYVDLGITFIEVLHDFDVFLRENPTETILVRIKNEAKKDENKFAACYLKETFEYKNRLWNKHANPKLGEVRGKMVVLDDFSTKDSTEELSEYGLNYKSTLATSQDDYKLTTNWDLYDKWKKVKAQMYKSELSNGEQFYMNFLSGAGGAFPYFVVSGHGTQYNDAPRLWTGVLEWSGVLGYSGKSVYPEFPRERVNCIRGFVGEFCFIYFEGTNIMFTDLCNLEQFKMLGIVYTDFPGPDFISCVIAANF